MLDALRDQHDLGVEPLAVIRGLLEIVHGVTVAKAGRRGEDATVSAEEYAALADWASQLGFAPLHRLWQLLLKGHDEVAHAILPMEAAEMALLRVMHAATLPDPGELARLLREGGGMPAAASGAASGVASSAPVASLPATFEAMVDLLWKNGQSGLADEAEHLVRPVRYAPPELVFQPASPMGDEFPARLAAALGQITGTRWQVARGDGEAQPSLSERAAQAVAQADAELRQEPIIKASLEAFPDAELLGIDDTEKWSASA
jgi:DNA polymerase-3 subunit gamma/tau